MSDVVSLELVVDAEAEAAVRREWELVAEAGLPSQARHTGASNRPHVTLLVRSRMPATDTGDLDGLLPFPVTLGAPLLFGSGRTRVLARSVVPRAGLLELHAAVRACVGPGEDAPHTGPHDWMPHVTLARRLPVERVGDALTALGPSGGDPIEARAIGIRRWDSASRTVSHVAGRGTLEWC